MNRTRMRIPRIISNISSIFMLLLLPMFGKAAPVPPPLSIATCYQSFYALAPEYKILHTGAGNPQFSYYLRGNNRYFRIKQFNPATTLFDFVDFPGRPFVWFVDSFGDSLKLYENSLPSIVLPNAESIVIEFYENDPSYEYWGSTTLDFIGPDEAFRILPYNKSCFTYDNFQLKNDLTDLEGFCGVTGNYQLKLSPSTGSTMGLPANFSMNISMGHATASTPVQVPINQSECTNPENSCAAYPPAPCRCMDFNFEFKLYPCTATQMPNCPTEITVSKPIKLCCNCGFQEPPISGTGRNTDNAELTQSGELSIFPNPNHNGKLQINTPNNPIRNIKIYAVDGRLVKEVSVPEQNKVSVDISGLKPGLYQVKVIDNKNAISNQKLIVQ